MSWHYPPVRSPPHLLQYWTLRCHSRSGNLLDPPEHEDVAEDADREYNGGHHKSGSKGASGTDDKACHDRCCNAEQVVHEVDDASHSPNTALGRDQGNNARANRCREGETAEPQRDPDDGKVGIIRKGSTNHAEAEKHSDHQQRLAYLVRLISSCDQVVHQPTANHEIREGRHRPRNGGVEPAFE